MRDDLATPHQAYLAKVDEMTRGLGFYLEFNFDKSEEPGSRQVLLWLEPYFNRSW